MMTIKMHRFLSNQGIAQRDPSYHRFSLNTSRNHKTLCILIDYSNVTGRDGVEPVEPCYATLDMQRESWFDDFILMQLHTFNSKHVMQYALFARLDKMRKLQFAMPQDMRKEKREEKKRKRKEKRERKTKQQTGDAKHGLLGSKEEQQQRLDRNPKETNMGISTNQ